MQLRIIRFILAGIVFIGTTPPKVSAHTEQEYVQWCFDRREIRERANDRDRLIKELRLWRDYDNTVEAIYKTYDNDTWAAWQTMLEKVAVAEAGYNAAMVGCGIAVPCQNAAMAGYLVAIAIIQSDYLRVLKQVKNTKDSALLEANTILQDGLEDEATRYNNTTLAITFAWQECVMNTQHHTNPH